MKFKKILDSFNQRSSLIPFTFVSPQKLSFSASEIPLINPSSPLFKFDSFAMSIPHKNKANLQVEIDPFFDSDTITKLSGHVGGAGEDSFLRLENSLAVADGVGGWSFIPNGNSSLYSRLILGNLASLIDGKNDLNSDSLATCISKIHSKTNKHKILGGTTLCICSLNGENFVSANIGDSGFILIRDGEILRRSTEQVLGFNCPNQMGPVVSDTKPCDFYSFKVQEGDIAILFTDGVSDNIFDKDLIEMATECQSSKEIAESIAMKAMKKSNSNDETPFEKSAESASFTYKGGKPDDITVVVGRIQLV